MGLHVMGMEITEHSELPQWMLDRLTTGEATATVGGQAGSAADFLAAAAAKAAEQRE
jgi:hypothetical protein